MSVSSEVKRTLVKSPPELWAELSDPNALARHLGELGEVRIVRTEPDQAVEWEAPLASGTVRIEPSGWGTKVTLTATRAIPPAGPEAEAADEPGAVAENEPDTVPEVDPAPYPELESDLELEVEEDWELEAELASESEIDLEPHLEEPQAWQEAEPPVQPSPAPAPATATATAIEPEPRRGFFVRLFRRRPIERVHPETPIERDPFVGPLFDPPSEPEPLVDPEPEAELVPIEPLAELEVEPEPPHEPEPAAEPEPAHEPEPVGRGAEQEIEQEVAPDGDGPEANDLAAELAELEERTTAVLVGVLDRLGAAHHRPFSRA